jgi:glutamate-1-semialdehyde 2,1-aminomutase
MKSPALQNHPYREIAQESLVGGVSSSFRINPFTAQPMYLSRASGPHLFNLEGQKFIDFFMGHGAITLGHNRPEIFQALQDVLPLGFVAEYDNPLAVELAQKIIQHVPCAKKVRYVNSGSEGTLLAMRLVRGFTGRPKVVRIDGHFHGGHDYALANNLASKIDRENPGDRISNIGYLSAGIPEVIRQTIYLIPWNRPEVFEELAREKGHEIAALLMNPIDFNNGCVTTTTEYLQTMRDICNQYNIILIFDEILSGFKTGISCAQGYYGVTPDLCLLGKALTNGVPLGAIAGKEEIMMKIMDPQDPVLAGGTFSGNLLGCAAGLAAMRIMESPGMFHDWLDRAAIFFDDLQALFDELDFPARVQHLGCGFYIYVGTRDPIKNYHDFSKLNPGLAQVFFRKCIQKGVYFHTDFTLSAAHDQNTLENALDAIRSATLEAKKEADLGIIGKVEKPPY